MRGPSPFVSPWVPLTTLFLLCAQGIQSDLEPCKRKEDCGWNSACEVGSCHCLPGYKLSDNRHDCYDTRCTDERCLDCSTRAACKRCVDFIEERTGDCLNSCNANYVFMVDGDQVGRVCPDDRRESDNTNLFLGVTLAITAGIIFTVIITTCFVVKTRTNRKQSQQKVLFQNGRNTRKIQPINDQSSPLKVLATSEAHHNSLYGVDSVDENAATEEVMYTSFLHAVAVLRPYTDTFIDMLSEAKLKVRALSLEDNRVYVYKNVIHQLCRVLTVLNTENSAILMPPDGDALMSWGHKILQKYINVQQSENEAAPGSSRAPLSSTFQPKASNAMELEENFSAQRSPSIVVHPNHQPNPAAVSASQDSLSQSAARISYRSEILTFDDLTTLMFPKEDFTEPVEV